MSIAVGRGRDRSIGFGRVNMLVPDLYEVLSQIPHSGHPGRVPAHNGEESPELDDISNYKDQCIEYLLALGSTWCGDNDNNSDDTEKRHSDVDPVKDGLPESLRNKYLSAAPYKTRRYNMELPVITLSCE